MAGIGLDDGKAAKALRSVEMHLATEHGVMLQQPAYSEYDKYLGEISSYPPGYKENAGIFCHNNPWIVIAEAMLGNGDKSYDYFTRITPSFLQDIQDLRKSEPYVYSQMVAGRDAATPGQAKNSWLTGTAAWCYYAASHYILGIQPDYDGLSLSPCLPKSWAEVKIHREYRGAQYDITISNPKNLSTGVFKLLVDGEKQSGNTINYERFKASHKIELTLEKA
jgi:cellobiose phosphorylase